VQKAFGFIKFNLIQKNMEVFLILVFIFLFFLVVSGLRIVNQYERGVVLTLGRYSSTRVPGLNWIFPIIQIMKKVDMRVSTIDIPQQEAITKDNVPVGINGVVYFRVEKAELAVLEIQNYSLAVSLYAQAALRDIIGSVELDTLLTERDKVSGDIKQIVDEATNGWGIDISDIKIQDIELPADMKRVMAKQAESERERRAVIIRAQGELKASEDLSKAAQNLANVPGGLSLRTLKTIETINPDPSKTVIFALPVEVMDGIKSLSEVMKRK
jgi:regulator of protease activity HflC (stomatin/prohibitin superfamily)